MSNRETTLRREGNQGLQTAEDRQPPLASDSVDLLPAVDIFEDSDAVYVLADMPGVTRESLGVEVADQMLEIQGDIDLPIPEGVTATFAEVRASRYRRRFSLGQAVDRDGIEASIRDGVLELRLPKTDPYRRRRIEVQAA